MSVSKVEVCNPKSFKFKVVSSKTIKIFLIGRINLWFSPQLDNSYPL